MYFSQRQRGNYAINDDMIDGNLSSTTSNELEILHDMNVFEEKENMQVVKGESEKKTERNVIRKK